MGQLALSESEKRPSSVGATVLFLIRLQAGGMVLLGIVLMVLAVVSSNWVPLFNGLLSGGAGIVILALMTRWKQRSNC